MRKLGCWIACCLAAQWLWPARPAVAASADAHFHIDSFGPRDGLTAKEVVSMIQTRDGYLWMGTLNGLVRFDGMEFKVFDEHNTPGLASGQIIFLFEDTKSNLWIGTDSAGALLDQGGRITDLGFGKGSREGNLRFASEDAAGNVWLRSTDGRLAGFRNAASLPRDATPAGSPQVADMARPDFLLGSKSGGYWRLAMDGADRFVEKWTGGNLNQKYAIPGAETVTTACEDLEGNLIVGSKGDGVWWFDGSGHATHISQAEGLSSDYVLSLLVDGSGNLWVGLDGGGLNRVQRQLFHPLDATANLTVHSVAQDRQGRLWFSSTSRGVDYLQNGLLKNTDASYPISRFDARALLMDRDQNLWAATFSDGLFLWNGDQFLPAQGNEDIYRAIYAVHQSKDGLLWVGTQRGLWRWDGHTWKAFTTNEGLTANIVRAIADDASGNLWIGTEGGGLDFLRDGKITSFQPANGFPTKNISALYIDKQDVLWVGTLGNGLIRVEGGHCANFTTDNGLNGNGVDYIIEDDQGFLWIGSNAGLMRLKKSDLNDFAAGKVDFVPCNSYGERDGLPSSECTLGSQPAACRGADGTLWFPTIKGLASIDPSQIRPRTNSCPVLIQSVLIEGHELGAAGPHGEAPGAVEVPPGKELLEIRYAGLNLDAPDQVRYRYRMDNYESKWTDAGKRRSVQYTKLPPGSYQFQIAARNEDGTWNPATASLAVTVLPAFWQTWTFRASSIAALLAVISAFVYFIFTQKLQRQVSEFRQQQALEKDRARIARDIHDQVGASLTQLSLLGEMVEGDKTNPEEVAACASQITQTARETARALDEIVWTVNPSNDTLEGLVNYICKHAQEYLAVAGLRYRLEAPSQLPAAEISPEARHNIFLAAKESITNIVKHAQATEACIRLRLAPGSFTLEIEDNGRGPAGHTGPAAQTRSGLRNMRKRMEDIGGKFDILAAPGGGTVIRLTAPIRASPAAPS